MPKEKRSPNKGSFSLCERREAAKIRNQEMCDIAISIIGEYIDKHLNPSDLDSKRLNDDLENLSYARWAAYEIMERLNNEAERLPPHLTQTWREPIPPVDIIAGFLDDLENYIYDGCSARHEHIFTIAKDVVDDIILLFL